MSARRVTRSLWRSASSSPTTAEEFTTGYRAGDRWLREDAAREWVLTDESAGTWTELTGGGGGGGGLTSPVGVADGGTGGTSQATARAGLGLVIGTDVAAYDAGLVSLAAVDTAADRLPYTSGSATWTWTTITAAGRALLDDADAAAQRSTLSLVIGTHVAAYDAGLASLATVDTGADLLPYTTGANTWASTTLSSFARTLLDDANAAAMRDTLSAASRYQVRQVWALGGLR